MPTPSDELLYLQRMRALNAALDPELEALRRESEQRRQATPPAGALADPATPEGQAAAPAASRPDASDADTTPEAQRTTTPTLNVESPDLTVITQGGTNVPTTTIAESSGYLAPEAEGLFSDVERRTWSGFFRGEPEFGEQYESTLQEPLIDVDNLRQRLAAYKTERALENARRRGYDLTPELEQRIRTNAYNDAHREIRREIERETNAFAATYDSDPEGTTQRILTDSNPFNYLQAWMNPYSHTVRRPVARPLADGGVEIVNETGDLHGRRGLFGNLIWLGQIGPLTGYTAVSTRAGQREMAQEAVERGEEVAPVGFEAFRGDYEGDLRDPGFRLFAEMERGVGSREQVEAVRRGEDITFYLKDIVDSPEFQTMSAPVAGLFYMAKRLAGVEDEQAKEEAQGIANYVYGVPLALTTLYLEPDAIFAAGATLGRGARVARQASMNRAANKLGEEAVNLSQAANALDDLDELFTLEQVNTLRGGDGVSRADIDLYTRQLQEGIDEALRPLSPATREFVQAHVQVMAADGKLPVGFVERSIRASRKADDNFVRVARSVVQDVDRSLRVDELAQEAALSVSRRTSAARAPLRIAARNKKGNQVAAWQVIRKGSPRTEPSRIMRRTSLADAEFQALRQRHLADAVLERDLNNLLNIFTRTTDKGLKVPTPATFSTAAQKAKFEKGLAAAFAELQSAHKARLAARTNSAERLADARILEANQKLRTLGRQGTANLGESALDGLRAQVQSASAATKQSLANLENFVKITQKGQKTGRVRLFGTTGRSSKSATIERLLAAHKKDIKRLTGTKTASQADIARHVASLHAKALRQVSASLRAQATRLARGPSATTPRALREARENMEDLVDMLPAVNKAGEHVIDDTKLAEDLYSMLKTMYPRLDQLEDPVLTLLRDIGQGTTRSTLTLRPGEFQSLIKRIQQGVRRLEDEPLGVARGIQRRDRMLLLGQRVPEGTPAYRRLILNTTKRAQMVFDAFKKPAITQEIGISSREVQQIVKGSVDASNRSKMEVARLLESAYKWARGNGVSATEAVRVAAIRMLDGDSAKASARASDGSMVNFTLPIQSVLYGRTTGTLYQQGKAYLLDLPKDEMVEPLRALARMWLPNAKITEKLAASLVGNVRKALKDSDTYEQFAEAMRRVTNQKLTAATKEGARAITRETRKAHGFALQAFMQAAVDNRMVNQLIAQQAGFTRRAAEAMMALNSPSSAQTSAQIASHVAEAMALIDRLGVPPRVSKLTREAGEDIAAGLIMMNRGGTTESALIPRQFIAKTNQNLERITKELDEFRQVNSDNGLLGRALGYAASYMRLLRTSITTGLFFHSPRYLTNMFLGNISQILSDPVGATRAAGKSAAQSTSYAAVHGVFQPILNKALGDKAPELAQGLNRLTDIMVEKYGPDGALPSLMGTFWNRHVSNFFDSANVSDDVVVRMQNGLTITMGELRELALREGVLSSYASTDLMDLLSRTADTQFITDIYRPLALFRQTIAGFREGGVVTAAQRAGEVASAMRPRLQVPLAEGARAGTALYFKKRGQLIADFADSLEQRQRAALFLDMVVSRGKTPEEAGNLVRSALYDWAHPMTKIEAEVVNNYVLFYRFWKLALGQGMRILTQSLARGFDGTASFVQPTGSTALGKVVAQAKGLRGVSELMQPDDELLSEENKMLQDTYATWTDTRATPFLGNMPMNEAMVSAVSDLTGRARTHISYAMNNLTPLDSTSLIMSALSGSARIAQVGADAATGRTDVATAARQLSQEVGSTLSFLASNAAPPQQAMLQGLATAFIPSEDIPYKPTTVTIKPTEAAMLRAANYLFDPFFSTPETFRREGTTNRPEDLPNRQMVSAGAVNMFRSIPMLGNEITYWVDPLLSVGPLTRARVGEDASYGMKLRAGVNYLLRQYTGFGKEYYTSPREEIDAEQRRINNRIDRRVRDLERRMYAPALPEVPTEEDE